jgi:hypothetical protein
MPRACVTTERLVEAAAELADETGVEQELASAPGRPVTRPARFSARCRHRPSGCRSGPGYQLPEQFSFLLVMSSTHSRAR